MDPLDVNNSETEVINSIVINYISNKLHILLLDHLTCSYKLNNQFIPYNMEKFDISVN